MVIAEPTGALLLEENRQRLLRELPPLLRAFEQRYELRSVDLELALGTGRIADTEEVCEWMIAWETYCALTAGGFHNWNSWPAYLDAHNGKIGDYLDHFIIEDRLEHTLTTNLVQWVGELVCADGYEIHMRRLQIVDIRQGVPWVKTSRYSYQGLHRRTEGARKLFRYDNIHAHPGHPSRHHRHRFDRNGVERLPVDHIGEEGWPNLGQVLDELYVHWQDKL